MTDEYTDQMGNVLRLPATPCRIVSLVPSQTELLFDLGCGDRVAGVTRYCIHPGAGVAGLPVIGGTKKFDFDRIRALEPDLILGNKEENYPEGIETLQQEFPVWMSDIVTFDDALAMIRAVGDLVAASAATDALCGAIDAAMAELREATGDLPSIATAYFIWRRPWMVVGSGNFIDALMAPAGFGNVFGDRPRYPEVSADELNTCGAELVLLSSEPYPFDERHVAEIGQLIPGAEVRLVDGTMFSWYGSRLLPALRYLTRLAGDLRAG